VPQDEEFFRPRKWGRPTAPAVLQRSFPAFSFASSSPASRQPLKPPNGAFFSRTPYVEALVLAILLGMAVRSFWNPSERWQAGIAFSAKHLLEVAVMLLGASISFCRDPRRPARPLLGAIAAIVVVTLGFSFGISRMLGLPTRLSILIACGNSICGNSAIAAVAPVIGADGDDIASSISFTAILGVMMVLGLPAAHSRCCNCPRRSTEFSPASRSMPSRKCLPQTVPAGLVSTQIGTLVKLMRVLIAGGRSWWGFRCSPPRLRGGVHGKTNGRLLPARAPGSSSASFLALFPFLRSLDIVPATLGRPADLGYRLFLTVVSMAALRPRRRRSGSLPPSAAGLTAGRDAVADAPASRSASGWFTCSTNGSLGWRRGIVRTDQSKRKPMRLT